MRHPLLTLPLALLLVTPSVAADWPQFRGPSRDNLSSETNILRSWPETGPEVLWRLPVAEGYSGPAIVDGFVYVNDYDVATSEWTVRSLDLLTGEERWTFREKRRIRPNHGITRTVPAVDGKRVFAFDPKAVLHALDAETGTELWRKNLVQDYGAKIPPWYNGQCPLLDDGRLILGLGAAALMVALDPATGDEIWRTPNPNGWLLSHASVMPARLGGVDQYIYNTLHGVHGVARDDGRLLWHHPFKFNISVSPSPLALDDGRVFVTAGYDAGSEIFSVKQDGEAFTTTTLVHIEPGTWNSEIHTPMLVDGHLFGVDKKKRGQLTCLDPDDGSLIWTSTPVSFDLGGYLAVDGVFFLLDGRTGLLRLVEISSEEYRELASAQVLEGHDVWAPLALSNGILVLRDMHQLIALRVSKS